MPRRAGDPPELVARADRAARVLGWNPERADLDDIIRSAWTWHLAHPHGYSEAVASISHVDSVSPERELRFPHNAR